MSAACISKLKFRAKTLKDSSKENRQTIYDELFFHSPLLTLLTSAEKKKIKNKVQVVIRQLAYNSEVKTQ